ncbi:outer membrane beta-barrel protein [Roseomonas sp. E05]|uniref:outer membrane beta-barrel protein n=1 Tax=Roseomonas sp. E05 TaxID=3046310 RepID=UPI0024BBB86E|nr:outer membrane beta-barrel protein [Roseomonas sp. E05]MDJ0387770.1 outer membrane beta-barrel protein [Roseomonas sp. E05]
MLPGAVLLLPALAAAQTQTIGPEATERGVTVLTRPRPDYDPTGVRLGAFRIDGAVEAGMGFSDNIEPSRSEELSDGFFSEQLTAGIGSQWTRHAVGLSVTQDTRQYLQYSAQNWNDYGVGINGRYDVGRASSLNASYNHLHSHLSVDNFDVQQQEGSLSRPVPFDSDIFQVGGTAAFNRLALSTSLSYATIRYENETNDGVLERNSEDDYDSKSGEFRGEYSLVQGRRIVGLVRLQDISYTRTGQSGRDSFTWEAQAGFDYDFDGVWQARLLVGYRQRDYDEPGRKSLTGPAFEGQVMWMPSQLTTATVAVQRTIEESIRQDNVSYTRTAARLTVDHEMLRNVIVTGELRAEHRDYPERGTVTDGIALVGAQILLNRHLALNAQYQHTERLDAPEGYREYGINEVLVRLRFAL